MLTWMSRTQTQQSKQKELRGNGQAREALRGQQSSSNDVEENMGAMRRALTQQKQWS
jgi:hypothetical protein